MDDETRIERERLAAGLLLEAGRLMEDSGVVFALALPTAEAIAERARYLDRIASDLHGFAHAAVALLHVSDRT
jgi:hypothetical protein